MVLSDFATGTLLSLGAVIAFGVHTSFAKTKWVIDSKISMPIYNTYFLFGASLTCFIESIILAFGFLEDDEIIKFTYLGIIAALLLLSFEVFILLSIQQIGIGYATGFNVFSASITAPIAQIILGQSIEIWYIMVIGLIILALSVFLMSALRDILAYFQIGKLEQIPDAENEFPLETLSDNDINTNTEKQNIPLIANSNNNRNLNQLILGLFFSSLSGIFLAVLPLPSLYTDFESEGLKFFLSFGIGCCIVMPLAAFMIIFVPKQEIEAYEESKGIILWKLICFKEDIWKYKQYKVIICALLAGIIWSGGNICGFLSFLYLDYTVAVSFVQCNVIIALFLSIVLWKEITNKTEIIILSILCLGLIAGCIVVVYGVFGSFNSLDSD